MRPAILLLVSIAVTARAADVPTLDPTFADHGVSTVGFDFGNRGNNRDSLSAFALSTGGRLLLGGNYATGPIFSVGSYVYLPSDLGIVRLLADGTRDSTFGTDGRVMLGLVPPQSFGEFGDIVSLPDGRVFYAGSYVSPRPNGTYQSGLLIGRLRSDGAPDPTFHLDRVFSPGAFLPGAQIAYVQRVKLQADGKILILVIADNPNPVSICAGVMRLTQDGATDTTFGHGSGVGCYAPSVISAPDAYANDFVPLSDGGLVMVGAVQHSGGNGYDFGIAKIRNDGTLDSAFGTDSGWNYVAFDRGSAYTDSATSVLIDSAGRIVVAGFVDAGTTYLATARLLPNGHLDTTYGVGGRMEFPTIEGTVISSILLPNDRVLIEMLNPEGVSVSLTMLTRDGAVDTDFANAGTFAQPDITGCIGAGKINNATQLIGENLYLNACHDNAIANPDHSVNQDFAVAKFRYDLPVFRSGFEPGG